MTLWQELHMVGLLFLEIVDIMDMEETTKTDEKKKTQWKTEWSYRR